MKRDVKKIRVAMDAVWAVLLNEYERVTSKDRSGVDKVMSLFFGLFEKKIYLYTIF